MYMYIICCDSTYHALAKLPLFIARIKYYYLWLIKLLLHQLVNVTYIKYASIHAICLVIKIVRTL